MSNALDNDVCVELDNDVYDLISIYKTCYLFTDNCYLYLTRPSSGRIKVQIKPKEFSSKELDSLKGEFLNELINQRVRQAVNDETGKIRELIIAQAFAEDNLVNPIVKPDDYLTDPFKIAQPDRS